MSVTRVDLFYFTPDDDVKSVLDSLPARAVRTLDIEIYGLTDLDLVGNIIQAANRGVKVRVMNDRSQAAGPSDKKALAAMKPVPGITIKIVESIHGAIDHLKNIVIDGEDGAMAESSYVGYGSYNYSAGAQKQDNCFELTNDPGKVALVMGKFERDWMENIQKPEWQVQ